MKAFFYGNYFLGFCAVVLSIEASLMHNLPINDAFYYIFIFFSVIVYYTHAYTSNTKIENERDEWYRNNSAIIYFLQIFYVSLCALLLLLFVLKYNHFIFQIKATDITLIAAFPILALGYYGVHLSAEKSYNLRHIGWLKPFIIGFIWGGVITVYPIFYHNFTHNIPPNWTFHTFTFFINNMMFAVVLSIMFDIKDYADDANIALKTYIVRVGLRKTIYFILIPLCLAGIVALIIYAYFQHISVLKTTILLLPFLLLLFTVLSLKKAQSLMYYLIVVDGLLFVKAICGIVVSIGL